MELPAGHHRHRQIEEDDVRRSLGHSAQRFPPVRGGRDVVPFSLKRELDKGADAGIVIYHQDVGLLGLPGCGDRRGVRGSCGCA